MCRALGILCMIASLAVACDDAPSSNSDKKTADKAADDKAKAKPPSCGGGIVILVDGIETQDGEPTLSGEGPEEGKGWQESGKVVGRCGLGAGEWTVTAELEGYKPISGTVNIVDGKTQVLRLRMKQTGSVRLVGARTLVPKKLVRLDGKSIKSDGGFPPGLYKVPGYPGLHFAIGTGQANVVYVSKTPTNAIMVGGLKFALDSPVKVVLFDQEGGHDTPTLSAQRQKKGKPRLFSPRISDDNKLEFDDLVALRSMVHMALLHADLEEVCADTFKSLAKRGLSSHFCIDFDGTIYQAIDLGYQAFHGGPVNSISVGIDLNNMSKNLVNKKYANTEAYNYAHARGEEMRKHPRKKSKLGKINSGRVQTYGYTEAQYRALGALLRALTRIFPQMHATYPFGPDGEVIFNAMEGAVGFQGILGHWHVSENRWDPGPGFDWKRMAKLLKAVPEK